MRLARTMSSLAAVLVCCAGAWGQTHNLEERYEKGQVIVVRGHLVIEVKAVGGEPKGIEAQVPGVFHNTQKGEVRFEVLEAPDGFPAVLKGRVLVAESIDQEPGAEPKRTISPLAGKTVTIKAAKEGDATFLGEDGAPVDKKEAKRWCDDLPFRMFRGVDVSSAKVGQEWDVPEEIVKKNMDEEGGIKKASLHLKFAEVVKRGDRQLARVEFALAVSGRGESEAQQVSTTLTGNHLFDLEARRPVSMEAEGTIKVEARIGEAQAGTTLVMEGPAKWTMTFERSGR